jgi:glycogen synthase
VRPPSDLSDDIYTRVERCNPLLAAACEQVAAESGPFDLLHAHDWLVACAAVDLKHSHKIPLVTTIHATEQGRSGGSLKTDLQRAIHSAEWWLTYESWRVICCSRFMAEEVQRYFRVPGDKVDVVPNGISTERFDRLDGVNLAEFRRRFALPEERIVFFVGRIVYEKGVSVLLDAVPRVLTDATATRFVVAGTGPMLAELKARALAQGIADRVLFTGFVPDADRDRMLKIADCVVFPSLYEPFGIVALEAMAARAPVVVSEVGGLAEVVQHGVTGITVHPGDPASLAWGIVHTLSHRDWAAARVRNAYERAVAEYGWDRIATCTKEIYARVLSERALATW